MIDQVRVNLRAQQLLRTRAALVAVSGGLDSMVLLHVLHEIGRERGWRLAVAHLNHGLRGASSAADQRLVERTATRLGLPCVVEQADVRRHAREAGVSIEMAARELRHAFLARVARARRLTVIVLAHHADDQVELFLLRLLRGAGSAGLAGMKWRQPSPADRRIGLVRPLLNLRKAELHAFAKARRIPFREDASNRSLDYARNRIRRELIPFLVRRYQPALARVVLRHMQVLGAESEWLDTCACDWLRRPEPKAWADLPVALQRRVLHRQLLELGVEPDFDRIELLRTLPDTAVTFSEGRCVACAANGRLRCEPPAKMAFRPGELSVSLRKGRGRAMFGQVTVQWVTGRGSGVRRPPARARCEWFDADRVGDTVGLRYWRPGDRFQPSGLRCAAKLQDLFTNARIPRDQRRDRVVAVTADGTIWWVEGLRIAEAFKLHPGTRRRLCWEWKRSTPEP